MEVLPQVNLGLKHGMFLASCLHLNPVTKFHGKERLLFSLGEKGLFKGSYWKELNQDGTL